MQYLAICRNRDCRFAFKFEGVSVSSRDAPTMAYCTKCSAEATVSEATQFGFFSAYQKAFPTALHRNERKVLFEMARGLASGRLTETDIVSDETLDPEVVRFFKTAILYGVPVIGLLWMILWDLYTNAESNKEHLEVKAALREISETLSTDERLPAAQDEAEPMHFAPMEPLSGEKPKPLEIRGRSRSPRRRVPAGDKPPPKNGGSKKRKRGGS